MSCNFGGQLAVGGRIKGRDRMNCMLPKKYFSEN